MGPSPDSEAARASTPQRRGPRKKGRAAHHPADRVNSSDAQDSTEPEGSTDDDILELLGSRPIPPLTQTPGLIQLTKTTMDAVTKKNTPKQGARRKPVPRDESRGGDTLASSELDQRDQARSRRGKKGAADPKTATEGGKRAADPKPPADETSGIDTDQSPTPSHSGPQTQSSSSDPLHLSSLSQSLPASFFAEAQKRGKDAQKWDKAPSVPPTGGMPLNWQQQQLQNEMTPSKNPKAGGRRASKAPAKAGGHKRRSSLDDVPVSGIAAAMQVATKTAAAGATASSTSPSKPAPSHFDSSIPFHTGYNVHRAPQTPLRANQRTTAVTAQDGIIELPVMGVYPRINPANADGTPANRDVAAAKPRYAGPTFHNSPAGSDLPKPDLDDF